MGWDIAGLLLVWLAIGVLMAMGLGTTFRRMRHREPDEEGVLRRVWRVLRERAAGIAARGRAVALRYLRYGAARH